MTNLRDPSGKQAISWLWWSNCLISRCCCSMSSSSSLPSVLSSSSLARPPRPPLLLLILLRRPRPTLAQSSTRLATNKSGPARREVSSNNTGLSQVGKNINAVTSFLFVDGKFDKKTLKALVYSEKFPDDSRGLKMFQWRCILNIRSNIHCLTAPIFPAQTHSWPDS